MKMIMISAKELIDAQSEIDPDYLYWKSEFDGVSEVRLYDAFKQEPIYTPEDNKALQLYAVSMDKDNRSIKVRATYPDRTIREKDFAFEFFGGVKWLQSDKLDFVIGYFKQAYHRQKPV